MTMTVMADDRDFFQRLKRYFDGNDAKPGTVRSLAPGVVVVMGIREVHPDVYFDRDRWQVKPGCFFSEHLVFPPALQLHRLGVLNGSSRVPRIVSMKRAADLAHEELIAHAGEIEWHPESVDISL